MSTEKHRIFIAGAGGIGQAVGLILREWADFAVDLCIGDISEENLRHAKEILTANSEKTGAVETIQMNDAAALETALQNCEVLLDCLPGEQAPRMAQYCRDFGLHYANLTEYVAETDEIIEIAKNADTGFILQTGLAPGFINILAMSLYQKFVEQFETEQLERIGMKVGAMTEYAHAPHFYGFTWSPIGVATEYVKSCRTIRNFEPTEAPALSETEKIRIDGSDYEADLTSGGAANLTEIFAGKVRSLDYKTLRHPGHFDWARLQIRELPNDDTRPAKLLEIMRREIPHVEEDFVLVHASVEGYDKTGTRRRLEKSFRMDAIEIAGQKLRAIQTTTAAPLAECAAMLLSGKHKGVVLQSQIEPDEFLNSKFINQVYGTV
jgi:saccharopine dehydrogenase-like NADP-dependent oxidoreductase